MPSNIKTVQLVTKSLKASAAILLCLFQPSASYAKHDGFAGANELDFFGTQRAFALFLSVGKGANHAHDSAVFVRYGEAFVVTVRESVERQAAKANEKVNFAELVETGHIGHAAPLPESVIDREPISCLAAGLSQSLSHPASVSAVFLCPQSGTPHLSGVGVVGGNKKPAQAGNTATGLNARENPGIGLVANLSNVKSMKSKKSKGAVRSESAKLRALASKQNLRLVLPCWVHGMTVMDAQRIGHDAGKTVSAQNISDYVTNAVQTCVSEADLLPDLSQARRKVPDYRTGQMGRGFTLALTLDRADARAFASLARAHGLSLNQGLAQTLAWYAGFELDFTPDDDNAGEEWKTGGVA
jgi:hypothetical protein